MTVKFCGVKRSHDPHYFTPPSEDGLRVAEEVECLGWYGPDPRPTIAEVATVTISKETHEKIKKAFQLAQTATAALSEAMEAVAKNINDFAQAMETQEKNND